MADEITVSTYLRGKKATAGLDLQKAKTGLQFDMAGEDAAVITQVVGTVEEPLIIPDDIATPGFLHIENKDLTNFVTIRPASGGDDLVKVGPGEVALFRLAAAAPYIIADTAPCRVEYLILED